MFRRKRSVNKKKLEHKLYLARENPEPIFDLSECDLHDVSSGIYSLCKVFLKTCLNLSNNQLSSLSGGGDLKDLHVLRILDISHNEFSQLPEEISLLTDLQELYINNNNLKKLPHSIGGLVNLKILNVSSNSLKCIPDSIGDLHNINSLNICDNRHLNRLPKDICKAQLLTRIELDADNFVYPPAEVCRKGTNFIIEYICLDTNVAYIPPNEVVKQITVEEKECESCDEMDYYQAKIWDLERLKQQKMQDFLEIEKNNEIMQRQEIELANAQRENKKKLLADIAKQQSKLDLELNKIQQLKEFERFKLIELLQEVENNADIAINKLLVLNKEPLAQLLEKEKLEEERLLAAVNKYNETLRKDDILVAMEDILRQETEKFDQFHQSRDEVSRSILEQELESDQRLSLILHDQDIQKAELVSTILHDSYLQKAAVGTLLERGDARSWGLLQQVRLVESQLAALTNIELDRKRLRMDEQLNDICEKRLNLSILLIDLLDQQKARRAELILTLQILEEHSCDAEDFWLKQYQHLLDKLPHGLSEAQKNIDHRLAQALLINGVLHCLPFLAKLTQSKCDTKSITEDELIEAGVSNKNDRKHILDAFQIYSKEKSMSLCEEVRPSAPVELEEATAPLPENMNAFNTIECVVCLDLECQTVFVPCGHLCCCIKCSGSVAECPLCRTDIERKITIIK